LIGGGFGGKADIAGQIHALLAKATDRPVKILYDATKLLFIRHATRSGALGGYARRLWSPPKPVVW
jgi:hypothetical protein